MSPKQPAAPALSLRRVVVAHHTRHPVARDDAGHHAADDTSNVAAAYEPEPSDDQSAAYNYRAITSGA